MRTLLTLCVCLFVTALSAQHYYLFIGTYTSGASKGIYVYDFNASTGETKWISNTDSAANPSFLVVSPNRQQLYAVNEVSRQQTGFVAAYHFDDKTGQLNFINRVPSGSENPCHLSITKDGKWLTVANYTGGSLAVVPIADNGAVKPFVQHIVHSGKGFNPQRQEKAHIHAAFFSPDEKYVLSPDLGLDQIGIYHFYPNNPTPLVVATPPYASTIPGTGPRHLDFSPDGKFVYLIEELGGAVTVFNYHEGTLTPVQHVFTHPDDFKGQPGSADIHLSPDGKFLYASNRGEENNIAIFAVDKKSGMLTTLGYQSTYGEQPRNFMIDPTGNFLLAANQKTSNIIVFKRDQHTGKLQKLNELAIPNPVCLKMINR